MARACAICSRPDREAIERALIEGRSFRDVAATFEGVSKDAAHRHLRNHISPALVRMGRAESQAQGDAHVARTARERFEELYAEARSILVAAKVQGNAGLSLQAIDRMDKVLDRIARIAGELDERPVINLFTDPEAVQLVTVVMEELSDLPERRQRLAERLDIGGVMALPAVVDDLPIKEANQPLSASEEAGSPPSPPLPAPPVSPPENRPVRRDRGPEEAAL